MLGKAGGQVRVMVLDRHEIDPRAFECVLARQVLGVQIVRHDPRLDREQPLEMLDALDE